MSNRPQLPCRMCQKNDAEVSGDGGYTRWDCPLCGTYSASPSAESMLGVRRVPPNFIAWVRERSEEGRPVRLDSNSLDPLIGSAPQFSVSQKQRRLLLAIERKTKHPGAEVSLDEDLDFPLGWCANKEEFRFLLKSITDRALITSTDVAGDSWSFEVVITPAGWDALDESRAHGESSEQGFVAMSFHDSMTNAWKEGIEPAVGAAGWRPYRVDSTPHADRIDVKIMAEIKRSRFVVADVTLQRPGVYFEAGYAIGLGKPVLWAVREDEKDQVHFDTRQYNHIFWKDPADLRKQLQDFVVAIIGQGPHEQTSGR